MNVVYIHFEIINRLKIQNELRYVLESEAYEYHIQIQEASPTIKSHLKTPARIIELWEN